MIAEADRVELTSSHRHLLRERRKALRLRRKVLARVLGLTLGAFNKYEAGERRPPRQLLDAWQAALDEARREAA